MKVTAEHELKLEAPAGFELPDLGGKPLEARDFVSIYHDTAGRSLARAGITLRRRVERGESAWQLKLPAADSRLELEEPGDATGPPPKLAGLLAAHLRRGPVTPVAELRTLRHGVLATVQESTIEATIDEVAVQVNGVGAADGFVEVELELRSGEPRRLAELARRVTVAGALRSDGRPKVFRALGIVDDPVERPTEPVEVLRFLLRAQLEQTLAHDPGPRLGRDPESLHDQRVAARRARALLRIGRTLVEGDHGALELELKWLGEILGRVRDLDVLLARLRTEAADLGEADAAAAKELLRALERQRARARRSLLAGLGSPRYLGLLDRLEETIADLVPAADETTLAALATAELARVRRFAGTLGDDPPDEALHELRKRVKRLRYGYELAGDDPVVKRAKALQDVLGAHQDAVVADERLRALAPGCSTAGALAAGLLVAITRERQAEARGSWRELWRKLDRAAR